DLNVSGALLAGTTVHIVSPGDIVNSGTIRGDSAELNAAQDLLNQGGRIQAHSLRATAGRDLVNLSGIISDLNDPSASQARSIDPDASHVQGDLSSPSQIILKSGRDLLLAAATQAHSSTHANGATSSSTVGRYAIVAGDDVKLDAG